MCVWSTIIPSCGIDLNNVVVISPSTMKVAHVDPLLAFFERENNDAGSRDGTPSGGLRVTSLCDRNSRRKNKSNVYLAGVLFSVFCAVNVNPRVARPPLLPSLHPDQIVVGKKKKLRDAVY